MKKIALALTALAALTGSASAADLAARPYTKAPVAGCGRLRAGPASTSAAAAATASGTQDNTVYDDTAVIRGTGAGFRPPSAATAGGRGYFGTVQAGYDWQFSSRQLEHVSAPSATTTSPAKRATFNRSRPRISSVRKSWTPVGCRRPHRLAGDPATADLFLGRLHRSPLVNQVNCNVSTCCPPVTDYIQRQHLQGLLPRRRRRIRAELLCPACSGRPNTASRNSIPRHHRFYNATTNLRGRQLDRLQNGNTRSQRAGLPLQLGWPGRRQVLRSEVLKLADTTKSPGFARGFFVPEASRRQRFAAPASLARP